MPSFASHPRHSAEQVGTGGALGPKLSADARVPGVSNDAVSHEVPMPGWINAQAPRRMLGPGWALCFGPARKEICRKGAPSGFVRQVARVWCDAGRKLVFAQSWNVFDTVAARGDAPGPTLP